MGQGEDGGRVYRERVALMIAYLQTHQVRLAAIEKGSVTFYFAGGSVDAEVKEKEKCRG